MRDVNRIDPFLARLGELWKENCPDWRFSQMINNLMYHYESGLFYTEEEEYLQLLEDYFRGIKSNA